MKFNRITLPSLLLPLVSLVTPMLGCDEYEDLDADPQWELEADDMDSDALPSPDNFDLDSGTTAIPTSGTPTLPHLGHSSQMLYDTNGAPLSISTYSIYSIAEALTWSDTQRQPATFEVCNGTIVDRNAVASFQTDPAGGVPFYTQQLMVPAYSCVTQAQRFRLAGGSAARRMNVRWDPLAVTPNEEFCSLYLDKTVLLRETGGGRYLRQYGPDTRANSAHQGSIIYSQYTVGCVQRDGQWRVTLQNVGTGDFMAVSGNTGVMTTGNLYGSGKWELVRRPNAEWSLMGEHGRYLGIQDDEVSEIGDFDVDQTDALDSNSTFGVIVQ